MSRIVDGFREHYNGYITIECGNGNPKSISSKGAAIEIDFISSQIIKISKSSRDWPKKIEVELKTTSKKKIPPDAVGCKDLLCGVTPGSAQCVLDPEDITGKKEKRCSISNVVDPITGAVIPNKREVTPNEDGGKYVDAFCLEIPAYDCKPSCFANYFFWPLKLIFCMHLKKKCLYSEPGSTVTIGEP